MALKHSRIYQPDPTKPQPGGWDMEHVDERGNAPPGWLYGPNGQILGLVSGDGTVWVLDQQFHTSALTKALDDAFGTLTFSRASANAAVMDSNGTMQFGLSGEARFVGARRVCNLIADSEGLTTGWTLGANTTKAALNVRSPNHSRASAYTVTRSSGAATMLTLDAAAYRPGKHTFSAWVMGDGVEVLTLALGATTQTVTPVAGVWTRVAVTADVANVTPVACSITNTTSGNKFFRVCDPQMEWTHNTAGAPQDYVPRGVAGFPATLLTAGADGVRYFDTANQWSLSSGVATKSATVTPLDPASLKGILLEPAATNQVYSSRDVSAAEWSKSGSTVVNATPTDSTLLGKNSLYKIEEIVASSGFRVFQNWRGSNPAVNARISGSAYVKAAERSIFYLGLRGLDGSTVVNAYYDTATGLTSNITAGCTAYMVKEGDLWRIGLTASVGSSGSTAPLIQVGICVTSGTPTYTGTLNSGGWVGAVQLELAGTPSSYVGDTSSAASLTRVLDSLSAVTTMMPAINWTLDVDYTPMFPTNTIQKDDWWYAVYSYVSSTDRAGFGMRPGTFGGFTDTREDEWFFDLYPALSPSATSWDGVEVVANAAYSPGETIKLQWSLAREAATSASNQTGRVGANAAAITSDSPRPYVNTLPTVPRTWTFGRQGAALAQRGPACFKNVSWYMPAATAAQMAAASP